jgi:hypothetical protein
MKLTRKKFLFFLLISCLAGYIWLFISFITNKIDQVGVCMFKHVTSIPCPSCGSTRSVLSLLQGNLMAAIYWNPIGLILLTILIIAPFWILFDFISKRDTLFIFYQKAEKVISKKYIAIPAILLIITNWIWNIYKDV